MRFIDGILQDDQTLVTYVLVLNVSLLWIGVGIICLMSPRIADAARRLAPHLRERNARRQRRLERIMLAALIVAIVPVPTSPYPATKVLILLLLTWVMLLGAWMMMRTIRQSLTDA